MRRREGVVLPVAVALAGALVAAAALAGEPARLGPGQPFYVGGAPVAVAFADGGATLVALADGRLHDWSVADAQPRLAVELPGARAGLIAAAGEQIALVVTGAVELHRARDGALLRRLGEGATHLGFADAHTLVLADAAGALSLVDVASGARRVLAPAQGSIGCLGAGGGAVFACRGGRLLRWSLRAGAGVAPVAAQPATVAEGALVAVSDSGVLAIAEGNRVRVHRPDGSLVRTLSVEDAPFDLALSPDGQRLALPRGDGIDLYDLADGRRLFADRPRGAVRALSFAADGTELTARDANGGVRTWHLADHAGVPAHGNDLPAVPRCTGAPTGRDWRLAPDCRSGVRVDVAAARAHIWRPGRAELVLPLPPRHDALVAFGADRVALATVPLEPPLDAVHGRPLARGELLVVDPHGARPARSFDGVASALAVAPARIAVGAGAAVLLFPATAGEPTRAAQPAPVRALAFAPAGDQLAAGLADGTVALLPLR